MTAQMATAGEAFSLDTSSHFSDVDHGDSLAYSIDGPAWLSIDPATGVITGTPPGHIEAQELTAGGDGQYDVPSSSLLQLSGYVLSSNAGYKASAIIWRMRAATRWAARSLRTMLTIWEKASH